MPADREYFKAYYERNKVKILAQNKANRLAKGHKSKIHNMNYKRIAVGLLLERDGNYCKECDVEFSEDTKPTIDHRYQRAVGGSDHPTNVRLLCLPCNAARKRPRRDKQLHS